MMRVSVLSKLGSPILSNFTPSIHSLSHWFGSQACLTMKLRDSLERQALIIQEMI